MVLFLKDLEKSMADLKLSDINWGLTVTEENDFQKQINFHCVHPVDRFALLVVFPFYRDTRDKFAKYYKEIEGHSIESFFKYTQNVYVAYKGKKLYVQPYCESGCNDTGVGIYSWRVKNKEYFDTVLKKYEQIEHDVQYLSLYYRSKFSQCQHPNEDNPYLHLHHYILPMALKANHNLMCFLEDNDKVIKSNDDAIRSKVEKMLSFYLGFNLVCNTSPM